MLEAMKKHGFMYMENHGVPADVVKKAFTVAEDFFGLPVEVKEAAFPLDIYTTAGYKRPGVEKLDTLKQEEGAKVGRMHQQLIIHSDIIIYFEKNTVLFHVIETKN